MTLHRSVGKEQDVEEVCSVDKLELCLLMRVISVSIEKIRAQIYHDSLLLAGRARPPPRSLRKSRRQERGSKDASKLLLLCDDHILDSDPMRESKDIAYAQAYLNRVRQLLTFKHKHLNICRINPESVINNISESEQTLFFLR